MFPIEIRSVIINEPMNPAEELPFHKGGCPGALYLHLVLVEAHRNHLKHNHEIGNGACHVADIIGVGHFYRVLYDIILDLIKDILEEMRMARHLDIVENSCQV